MAVMGIFWTPMALLQQTAAYVTTFTAQFFGAAQRSMIGPAIWQALYISVFGGLLFLAMIPAGDWLFAIIGHSPAVQKLESDYFVAMTYSALPTAIVAAASGFFSGIGQTRTILWINFAGLISNVVLDYLLIFGHFGFPALGIKGAGYATAAATWVSAAMGMALMLSAANEAEYRVRTGWAWRPDLIKRFLRFGVPSGLQWALEGLAFSIFLVLIGRHADGDAALAASSIVVSVMMLAILPVLGVAQAVSIQVGQFLGQDQGRLGERTAYHGIGIALSYVAIIGASFGLFPEFYLQWFENQEKADLWAKVATIVPWLLRFIAVFILFDSVNMICSFVLKGAGDTRFVSVVALLLPWPLMVLPTWMMQGLEQSLYWSWAAACGFGMVQALVFFTRFRAGRWQSMSVIK